MDAVPFRPPAVACTFPPLKSYVVMYITRLRVLFVFDIVDTVRGRIESLAIECTIAERGNKDRL